MQRRLVLRLVVLTCLAPCALAQGKVWVVDKAAGPGSNFTAIQPAIAAAAAGDTVLVRAGAYLENLVVSAKGLRIVTELGSSVLVAPGIGTGLVIQNLPAGESSLVRGLRFAVLQGRGLELTGCAGSVWIEDVKCYYLLNQAFGPFEALRATDSSDVALVRSELLGPTNVAAPSTFLAVAATNSQLFFYDCTVNGPSGWATPNCFDPVFQLCGDTPGSPALSLESCFVFASGTSFRGGNGGYIGGVMTSQKPGGSAIVATDSELHLVECTLAAGMPSAGVPVEVLNNSNLEIMPGNARHFAIDSPMRAGQSAVVKYAGLAGDLVFAVYGPAAGQVWFPQFSGVLLLSGITALPLGSVGPTGTLTLAFPFALFPPGFDVLQVRAQSFSIGTNAQALLGAPSALTVLNQAF